MKTCKQKKPPKHASKNQNKQNQPTKPSNQPKTKIKTKPLKKPPKNNKTKPRQTTPQPRNNNQIFSHSDMCRYIKKKSAFLKFPALKSGGKCSGSCYSL